MSIFFVGNILHWMAEKPLPHLDFMVVWPLKGGGSVKVHSDVVRS